MHVSLIAYTGEPEKIIAASAKLCYSESSVDELLDNLDDEKSRSFLDMLTNMGHQSPIEHASFTFGIEGVSRAFLAQMTRHRIASFSVQSQRYVKANDFKFITPPEIALLPAANKRYLEAMDAAIAAYNDLADILEERHYKDFVSQGISEKAAHSKAQKKAIEDARFVLPNASETKMVVTMNARSLMNFFSVRCCNRAQWEIKAVADEMLEICVRLAPTLFKSAGPSCVRGGCPEGKMSCGQATKVRTFYEDLKKSPDKLAVQNL